jgi:hypothetical protein
VGWRLHRRIASLRGRRRRAAGKEVFGSHCHNKHSVVEAGNFWGYGEEMMLVRIWTGTQPRHEIMQGCAFGGTFLSTTFSLTVTRCCS